MHWCQLRISSQAVWTNHCLKLLPGRGRWRLTVPNDLEFRGLSSQQREAKVCCFTPASEH